VSREGRVGVAIVGAGGWGKNHVRNFASIPEADLRYVCDRDDGVRRTMAGLYPGVDAVADLRVAIDDSAVSAIVVVTHAPIADGQSGLDVVRALEGGASSLAAGGARIELARKC
jgi:hypothetical protein